MRMSKVFILFSAVVLFSCGNRILYYGRAYTPTEKVDIFFRESDVAEPNEIMGKATLEVSSKRNSDKVQAKLIRRAKKKGADALIFDDISLTTTGAATGGAAAGVGRRRGFLGIFGSKTKYSRGQQVKATLIKYKKNIPG
ncbi:MAG: hypothetical protein MUC38_05540 [Cyclobacteriaceae bacterium]|nr:hypothetical protein [Cyclobacteriaceae bacterium]